MAKRVDQLETSSPLDDSQRAQELIRVCSNEMLQGIRELLLFSLRY